MKVAMIGLRGIPAKSGGVETAVENLAPRLVERGVDVTVFCRTQYCRTKIPAFKGVRLRYLPSLNMKITEAISHSMLSSIVAAFGSYDIVHFHALGNGIFSAIPRAMGKKTVVTLHGLDWERDKWGFFARTYLHLCERTIAHIPHRVISVSHKIQDHYRSRYGKEIMFIPNGISLCETEELGFLSSYGLEKGKYILFLSRLVPEKGVHFLINAFVRANTGQKLVIVGDPCHTEKYANELKASCKDNTNVVFTGPLYGRQKSAIMSNASFFVLPSTVEGMPIALLEAMSYGLCPLISDIRENADVAGDLAVSFRSRDEEDLRLKLEYMAQNPARIAEKGLLCRERVLERYTWSNVADSTLELYRQLMAAGT